MVITLETLICTCTGLNQRISKIDKRKEMSDKKRGGFKSKTRIPGCPSSLPPPQNAPKWAVAHSSMVSPSAETPVTPQYSSSPLVVTPEASHYIPHTGSATPRTLRRPALVPRVLNGVTRPSPSSSHFTSQDVLEDCTSSDSGDDW